MVGYRLGWFIVVVCSLSSVAHAGDSSSGSSESGSSESGSDSTGGESTGDTTSAESSDGGETLVSGDLSDSDSCGETCSGQGGVVFDAPTSTDVVSPFVVSVTPLTGCSCDTCGCFDDDAFAVSITLDGESVGNCSGNGQCTIEVSAPVGEHELRATAEYSFHGEGNTITINVTQSDVGETDDQPTSSGSDTSGGVQSDDDGTATGCGCTTTSDAPGAWWMVAIALGAITRRRRAP